MKFRAGPNKMEIEHLHGDDEVIVHDFKANCICGICGSSIVNNICNRCKTRFGMEAQ